MSYTEAFIDNTLMPFGRHKGKAMINIPAHYFMWLYEAGCTHKGVRKYIEDNMEALKKEISRIPKK